MQLFVDKKSSISVAKNLVAHGRSKHKFHFLRNQVNKGKLELVYCCTDLQIADVLTKSLKIDRFRKVREMLGLMLLDI